jgi:hypothetical protein
MLLLQLLAAVLQETKHQGADARYWMRSGGSSWV